MYVLVKEQEPKESTDSQPLVTSQSPEKYPPRKIAGWILLSVGLLSVVFAVAFINPALAIIGGYLILCSIICQTVKNHPGLVIGWGTFWPCAYFFPWFTSANMRMIFHPYVYQEGLRIQLIVSYAFWLVLFLLIFITVKNTKMKNHPFLFCGWVIVTQVYGLIPIAFRHTEETMKFPLVLSWCVILFLIVLVFFTGKCLYGHLKIFKER
jgi:hypothetical protein